MANKDANLHRPRGSLAAGRWSVDLDPAAAGWTWTSLKVLTLGPGETQQLDTGPCEMLVLPLAGACTRDLRRPAARPGRAGQRVRRAERLRLPAKGGARRDHQRGRRPVRAARRRAPAGTCRCGTARPVTWRSNCAARVPARGRSTTSAPRTRSRPTGCSPARSSRPAGNWSSYPPHKHDEDRPGESVLEEIYYFEIRDASASAAGRTRPSHRSVTSASTGPRSGPSTCSPRYAAATSS